MDDIDVQMKKWIGLLQRGELKQIVDEIQKSGILNQMLDKHIFKLLLYLSHTADKCKKERDIGKQIYKLANVLCISLAEIPDHTKYVSSLFHIIRCLLTIQLYEEASQICSYLNLKIFKHSHPGVNEIITKIPYLWHSTANNITEILQKDTSCSKYYDKLKEVITYELDIIQIVHKSYAKHLLMKIYSYLEKVASMSKKSNAYFPDFCNFIIKYLIHKKIPLDKDEKYVIYRHILHIISRIMCQSLQEKDAKLEQTLDSLSNYFKNYLKADEECYKCYYHFEYICFTLIKSVECLTNESAKSMHKKVENYLKIAQQYEYVGAIKWTALSIAQVLEPVFIYWETSLKVGKKMFLDSGMLLETLNLVSHISIFFIKQVSDKCKSCHDDGCTIRRDVYNAVVIKTRCIGLVSKLSAADLPKDICVLSRKFLEQNMTSIYEMKQCNCKCWSHLWSTCGTLIYNLGISSDRFYEESTTLFSLLCTCIIKFEGVQPKYKYISLQNPISSTLHRLSTVHYNNGMYREAMTASALNGLLSYNDPNSKAFRMWANIKHKCLNSKNIMELTMVACLKADITVIEEMGLYINLSEYDLVEICLREAKGLQEAKVNLALAIQQVLHEMTTLKASAVQYCYAVHLLAYHLLNYEHDQDISQYLKKAILDLKQAKLKTKNGLCLKANLQFFSFVNELNIVNKQTQAEMESTKFALYAAKLSEIGETDSLEIVPSYSKINIKEDSRIMTYLQKSVEKWKEYFKRSINDITQIWEPELTLHILIIAGEYARLYRYQKCEMEIWKLAYKLSLKLQDHRAVLYVTGRSISLRQFDHNWIIVVKELATKFKDSNNEDIIYALAIFWISLSDYYFESGLYKDAEELLNEIKGMKIISFLHNIPLYLYSLDTIVKNCYLYHKAIGHIDYSRYIIQMLYTMINLNEELTMKKRRPQDKYLFGYDILFSTTVNLSLRMNSLLAFREITAHLVRRLKTAQALGATIRVAELLKSLCYIDLSRSELNDCEVKLQGLEHILHIETFQLSMNYNLPKNMPHGLMTTPTRVVDPIRDLPQNDASPILKHKVFDLPDFLCHTNCDCYACQNISYQYLILASTHIRAQLCTLQKRYVTAFQHFHGAFQIRKKLMETENAMKQLFNNEHCSWQERFYIMDYIQLLLNFSVFLQNEKKPKQKEAENIIRLAISVCQSHRLEGHPIYMAVMESMLNNRFQKVFHNSDYSPFSIPDPDDIDTSKYAEEEKIAQPICLTPTNNIRTKKLISIRRNRTPPILKLRKVSMNFSDDEETNTSPSSVKPRKTRTNCRLTKRKILEEEYTDNVSPKNEDTISTRCKTIVMELLDTKRACSENVLLKDIVLKIATLMPDIADHLYKLVDNMDLPVTNQNVKKLIEMIENLKVIENTDKSNKAITRRTRNSKQSMPTAYNERITEIIELIKDIDLDEENCTVLLNKGDSTFENLDKPAKTDPSTLKNMHSTNEDGSEILSKNKGTLKKSSTENSKNTRLNEASRVRTRSTRRTTELKDTQSVKYTLRKSKEKAV